MAESTSKEKSAAVARPLHAEEPHQWDTVTKWRVTFADGRVYLAKSFRDVRNVYMETLAGRKVHGALIAQAARQAIDCAQAEGASQS